MRYEENEDSKERFKSIPTDVISITHISHQTFQIFQRFAFQNHAPREPNESTKNLKLLPLWKQLLLKHCKEPATAESLLGVIQQHQPLLVASNGSKSSEKSGGGWIIADVEGRKLLSRFNLDFGDITQINSHRAEIYGALSVFVFLHEYCQFYTMNLQSPIKYCCNNKEVVMKLSNITERCRNYYSSNSKIKDLDAVLGIQRSIPTTVTVTHVRGH